MTQLPELTEREYHQAHVISEVVIDRVGAMLREMFEEIKTMFVPRREISKRIRVQLLDDVKRLGGNCPCCLQVRLVDVPAKNYEWDHFYARNRIKPHEVWPICKRCHAQKSHQECQREFDAFQAHRAKLPGHQLEWRHST